MPRSARIVIPGIPHHVTQRGNRRQQVFFSGDDYRAYLKFLRICSESFGFAIWSYCLMPNHVHLLLVPSTEESLREGISSLHQSYTRMVNAARDWKGHLWQGRFFSCAVDPSKVALVAKYIELNPVRAKICSDPCDYPWSSADASCRGGQDGKSGIAPIYSPNGSWREFLKTDQLDSSAETITQIRTAVSTGRPYGSVEFLHDLEQKTGKIILPRKPGRKPSPSLMSRSLSI